jgi:phosphoglycolate phosphatase
MIYRAAIFDLDGTLLNTLDDIADSMNGALQRLGLPGWPVEQYRSMVGMGLDQLALRVLPEDRSDAATVSACLAAMRELYAARWAVRTRPYDGIPEMLRALRQAGIRCAVLSNKAHEFVVTMISHFFGDKAFELILGGGRFPLKPDPSGALHIAASIGLPPGEIVFIGDSDVDMKTAGNAGMFGIGATWGFRTREELLQNGAQFLAETPIDIVSAVTG